MSWAHDWSWTCDWVVNKCMNTPSLYTEIAFGQANSHELLYHTPTLTLRQYSQFDLYSPKLQTTQLSQKPLQHTAPAIIKSSVWINKKNNSYLFSVCFKNWSLRSFYFLQHFCWQEWHILFLCLSSLFISCLPRSPSTPVPSPSSHQIITALEEDTTAQKMQLGYRLQQIAAAVENKVTDLWQRKHSPEPWRTGCVGSWRWIKRLAPCRLNWKAGEQQADKWQDNISILSGGGSGNKELRVFEKLCSTLSIRRFRLALKFGVG